MVTELNPNILFLNACQNNNVAQAKAALENGASKTALNAQKQNALHLAAKHGAVDSVSFLMEECNLPVNSRDDRNRTPLHYAAEGGHIGVIEKLADSTALFIDPVDENEFTPRHLAVTQNQWDAVTVLDELRLSRGRPATPPPSQSFQDRLSSSRSAASGQVQR